LKKLFMVLVAVALMSGCTLSKQTLIAETLVKIAMRDIGYRSAQIQAMADGQSDPLMAANIRDLSGLLVPDAGIFQSGLDTAAAEGFTDGKRLFLQNGKP